MKPTNFHFFIKSFILIFLIIWNGNHIAYSQPVIDCPCPEGGIYSILDTFPNIFQSKFSHNDLTIKINKACWDFGTKDQFPDDGKHFYESFKFKVSKSGNYRVTGSDGNKMIIAIFVNKFSSRFTCSNMIFGAGGYVDDGAVLYFEEPQDNGLINNIVELDSMTSYELVVVDYDFEFTGDFSFSLVGQNGGKAIFLHNVYSDECKFQGCFSETPDLDYPLPVIPDDYSMSWEDQIFEDGICGEKILRRMYRITDTFGDTTICNSEYLFTGIDLENSLQWPPFWDGLEGNNPVIDCSDSIKPDFKGNPHPDVTGMPSGYIDQCGLTEVYYSDQVYQIDIGQKILRYWTIVDDCTGSVFEHIQVIVITNKISLQEIVGNDTIVSIDKDDCKANFEIPKLNELSQTCGFTGKYRATLDTYPLEGDVNKNSFYDEDETWSYNGLNPGKYKLCYYAITNDPYGTEDTACINLEVIDDIPPVVQCDQKVQISLSNDGYGLINSYTFITDSYDNCNSIYSKIARVNDSLEYDGGCAFLNQDGVKDGNTFISKYADNVFVCCEDIDNPVKVSIRVMDVDPGKGTVEPSRFEKGNDLYGHFSECLVDVEVQYKLPPTIDCKPLIISCADNLYPEEDPDLFPEISGNCISDIYYEDERNEDCGNSIIRNWTVLSGDFVSNCQQLITIIDTVTALDPCSIIFPADTVVYCIENIVIGLPKWDSPVCTNAGAVIESQDTIIDMDGNKEIKRNWAVIDYCVYRENTGAEDNVDSISGNSLDCSQLVEDGYYKYTQTIKFEDSLPVVFNCPELDVKCNESIYPEKNSDLQLLIQDFCGDYTTSYVDELQDDFINSIKRKWTVTNGKDTSHCIQLIKIIPNKEFNPCSITFPKQNIDIAPTRLDELQSPTWESDICNNITAEIVKEDTLYSNPAYQYSIIREWAVIDWFKYESNTGAGENIDSLDGRHLNCDYLVEDGYYRYIQTINVTKYSSVEIVVEDTCLGSKSCYLYDAQFSAKKIDSCLLKNVARWKYIITDLDNLETVQYSYNYSPIPATGVKGDIEKDNLDSTDIASLTLATQLPIGNYRIFWTVENGCGTVASKKQYFTIADKTPPVPAIIDFAEIQIIDDYVIIQAKQFDKGYYNGNIASSDNCSLIAELYFTFSANIPKIWIEPEKWEKQFNKYGKYFFNPNTGNISNIDYYLAGLADAWIPSESTSQRRISLNSNVGSFNIPDKIYVWDQYAYNSDCDDNNYAYHDIIIIDSQNNTAYISGKITTLASSSPFSKMNVIADGKNIVDATISYNGIYKFTLRKGNFNISGFNDQDYAKGVSTRDLILIRRYILGLISIYNPYAVIAMDANRDHKITAMDVFSLRKVLLRQNTYFENNSWLCISKDYSFANINSAPSDIEEASVRTVTLNTGDSISGIDFYAIKTGDIDFSLDNTYIPVDTSKIIFQIENQHFSQGDLLDIPVYANNFNDVYGFQFTMNTQGLELVAIEDRQIALSQHYNLHNKNVLCSFESVSGRTVADSDPIFNMVFRAKTSSDLASALKFTDKVLKTEAYVTDQIKIANLSLNFVPSDGINGIYSKNNFKLYQNQPNPFSNSTQISFKVPKSMNYKIKLLNAEGKIIKSISGKAKGGLNKLILKSDEIKTKGLIFYRLETQEFTDTKKMLIL